MKKFGKEASRIKSNELDNTLSNFFSFIGSLNLNCRVIGSSANKSKSSMGDIDFAVDERDITRKDLFNWFKRNMSASKVSNKGVLSILFPIYNSDNKETKRLVQMDFMFGDPDVLYHMYYSPIYGVDCPKDSPLKAKHRRVFISAFCYHFHLFHDVYCEKRAGCEPAPTPFAFGKRRYNHLFVRWKWSMKYGLQLIEDMQAFPSDSMDYIDTGSVVRKTIEPDFDVMAKKLIHPAASGDALKSAESFLDEIAKYTMCDVVSFVEAVFEDDHYQHEFTDQDIEYLRDYVDERIQANK